MLSRDEPVSVFTLPLNCTAVFRFKTLKVVCNTKSSINTVQRDITSFLSSGAVSSKIFNSESIRSKASLRARDLNSTTGSDFWSEDVVWNQIKTIKHSHHFARNRKRTFTRVHRISRLTMICLRCNDANYSLTKDTRNKIFIVEVDSLHYMS